MMSLGGLMNSYMEWNKAGLDLWAMNMAAAEVIWRRTAQMAGGAMSQREAARMVAEKAVAFAEGALSAGREAAFGGTPLEVLRAGMAPAARKAKANAKRLRRKAR